MMSLILMRWDCMAYLRSDDVNGDLSGEFSTEKNNIVSNHVQQRNPMSQDKKCPTRLRRILF